MKRISKITTILGLLLFAGITYAAFTPPTAPPPGANTPGPINVGPATQGKSGTLNVGTTSGSMHIGNVVIPLVPTNSLHVDGGVGIGNVLDSTVNAGELRTYGSVSIGQPNTFLDWNIFHTDPTGSLGVSNKAMIGGGLQLGSYPAHSLAVQDGAYIWGNIVSLKNIFAGSTAWLTPLTTYNPDMLPLGAVGADQYCLTNSGNPTCITAWPTATASSIPPGIPGQTLRYNPANTLQATSNIYNDPVNNNVGIGTASPSNPYKLNINGTMSNNASAYLATTSGNVGIGTITPNNKLQVVGLINFNDTTLNTALGKNALSVNTSGVQNTATGFQALTSNINGSNNTATGRSALRLNTSGNNNTAIGWQALDKNTTGYDNTAIGLNSLFFNTTGNNNTASGKDALRGNTTGNFNVAVGWTALQGNIAGVENTAVGTNALRLNTSGSNNTAVGTNALRLNTSGSNNTAIGNDAEISTGMSGSIALGAGALANISNQFALPTSVTNWKFRGNSYALPSAAGTTGQVLTVTAPGVLSFAGSSTGATTDASIISGYGTYSVDVGTFVGMGNGGNICNSGNWNGTSCTSNHNGGWPYATAVRDIPNKRFCTLSKDQVNTGHNIMPLIYHK